MAQWPENFTFENMKYLAITLLGILGFASYGLSQDWNTDTLEWSVFDGNFLGQGSTTTYSLGANSSINDTLYRSLLSNPCFSQEEPQIIGFIRQSGDSIFYRYSIDFNEFVFYDFSLDVGDEFGPMYCESFNSYPVNTGILMIVVAIDTIEVAGEERRRYYFDSDVIWYEGIGSDQGLFSNELCVTDQYLDLNCVHQNAEFIFGNADFEGSNCCFVALSADAENGSTRFSMFPNPIFSNEILTIEGLDSGAILTLLDISGREIQKVQLSQANQIELSQAVLPGGVYLLSHPALGTRRLIILEP